MCPNMHFGILVRISAAYSSERANAVLELLAQAHPFLRSVVAREDAEKLYYAVGEKSRIEASERDMPQTLWSDYAEIGRPNWNVFESGLLKVVLYPDADGFQVLFIAHHLLGDGRAIASLACEFAEAYAGKKAPVAVEERLIRSMDDLPSGSALTRMNRFLMHWANKCWAKGKESVTYEEYATFAARFTAENPVEHRLSSLKQPETDKLLGLCKENGISINDLLLARLFRASGARKVIIAADIRRFLKSYSSSALGNYASAIGVAAPHGGDLIKNAQALHRQVKRCIGDNRKLMLILACYLTLTPSLIETAAIAALGGFHSKAAGFIGSEMLGYGKRDGVSLTNLGALDCPAMESAVFIPPASPATAQTVGALTANGKLRLCSSFYTKTLSISEAERQLNIMVGRE